MCCEVVGGRSVREMGVVVAEVAEIAVVVAVTVAAVAAAAATAAAAAASAAPAAVGRVQNRLDSLIKYSPNLNISRRPPPRLMLPLPQLPSPSACRPCGEPCGHCSSPPSGAVPVRGRLRIAGRLAAGVEAASAAVASTVVLESWRTRRAGAARQRWAVAVNMAAGARSLARQFFDSGDDAAARATVAY